MSTIQPASHRRTVLVALTAAVLSSWGGGAPAQEANLRAERVVDFAFGKAATLNVKVGPVSVQSVEFSDRGREHERGGLASRLRGGGTASEASRTVRSHFLAQNTTADEWEVTFTLEFLDKSGKLIEKVTDKKSWEGSAEPFDLDHPILAYVLPAIAQVRIKMEARLD
jgi:hypothetical protein